MEIVLRQFMYLDEQILGQFLEQLEGGFYDEEAITERTERGRHVRAGLRAGPAELGGDTGKSGAQETSMKVRQTPASRFDRLHRTLAEQALIQQLAAIDDEIWDQLTTGELLEIEATLSVPSIVKDLEAVGNVEALLPLIEQVNEIVEDDDAIDPRELAAVKRQIPALSGFARQASSAPVPCFVHLAPAPRYKFLARLRRTSMQCSVDELDGHAIVLGKLQRKLRKGESETVEEELLGIPKLSREMRRKTGQQYVRLTYPGAVITPIAIWR